MLGEDRLQRCWGGLRGASEVGVGDGGRKETDCNPWPCPVGRLLQVRVDLGSSWEVPACLGLGIPSRVKFLDSAFELTMGQSCTSTPASVFSAVKWGWSEISASHGC